MILATILCGVDCRFGEPLGFFLLEEFLRESVRACLEGARVSLWQATPSTLQGSEKRSATQKMQAPTFVPRHSRHSPRERRSPLQDLLLHGTKTPSSHRTFSLSRRRSQRAPPRNKFTMPCCPALLLPGLHWRLLRPPPQAHSGPQSQANGTNTFTSGVGFPD